MNQKPEARRPVEARRQADAQSARRELLPGETPELLKTLHLMTQDGRLNADALRKLKQVNHLAGLLAPALDDAFSRHPDTVVADLGSGNAYLGFILYQLFFTGREAGKLVCVENRPDLASKVKERAQALGYARLASVEASIEDAPLPDRVHVLTALHACDTATDDALALAIRKHADHIAVVPCCQAEVAQQLKDVRPKQTGPLAALSQHAWHRREFGSHLTNVIRALTLEAHGYQVTVTELTGWEHSLKNELILARKVHHDNRQAKAKLDELLAQTLVRPKLIRTLGLA